MALEGLVSETLPSLGNALLLLLLQEGLRARPPQESKQILSCLEGSSSVTHRLGSCDPGREPGAARRCPH